MSLKFSWVDIAALDLVDEAYQDSEEWIKKSIRTTAKVSCVYPLMVQQTQIDTCTTRWASSVLIVLSWNMQKSTGRSVRDPSVTVLV